jgi:hypothetical protein
VDLSLLDILTILALVIVLAILLLVAPVAHGQVAYPTTSKIGKISVTVPSDSDIKTVVINSTLKRTQTTYHVSRSLDASITVVSIEFKDVNVARPRLTEFLTQFIANYGSVDHLATIKDDGRKGMNISTEIYHDKSQTRYAYVESRVFADDTHLYAVTIETEVTPAKPLRTDSITEVLISMKVN